MHAWLYLLILQCYLVYEIKSEKGKEKDESTQHGNLFL